MRKYCLILFFIFLIANESFAANNTGVDNRRRSLEMMRHASLLLRDGQLEEALVEYTDAEILSADETTRMIIDDIRAQITKITNNKTTAQSLRKQAVAHVSSGHLELAIEKLEESLIYYEDQDVRSELAIIEGRYKAESQKQKIAYEMLQIAEQLERRDELEAALSKLEEARTIWNLPQIVSIRQRIQRAIEKREAENLAASKLSDEATKLQIQASMEQKNDMELLQQALELLRQSFTIVPARAVEMAIIQTEQSILKISADIKESEKRAKEARLLEGQGRIEAALEVYNISLRIRHNDEVANEFKTLQDKHNEAINREKLANELYTKATDFEIIGELDEALSTVRKALETFQKPEGDALRLRLERSILERDQRKAKGAELAIIADNLRTQELFPEALNVYLESWASWPYSSAVREAIDALESLVKDTKSTEERASRLYNEGLGLEGEERYAEAIEKITGSMSLIHSKEAEEKLSELKEKATYKNWLDTLLMKPLELKQEPVLPMIGKLVTVRIDGSSWLDSERLTYKWELSDNAKDSKIEDGGKAVSFRASDETPVILDVEIYTKDEAHSKNPIMKKKFSTIADSYTAQIKVVGINAKHQKWNTVKKQLEPVNELVTRSDILLRVDISPSIEGAIYEWSLDEETFITGDNDKFQVNVRSNNTGLRKVGVTIKDASEIEIGRSEISFVIPVAYEDVMVDLQRAEAWQIWLEAQKLWMEHKRLDAIKKASQASSLDPSDPDITTGLTQLYNDNARIEEAYYLSALASLRKLEEKYDEAILSLKESERLYPEEKKRLHILSLEAEMNDRQNKSALADRFRAEGDWLLAAGRKVEAISKYRESLLLQENDYLYVEILKITREVENENHTKNMRKELLQKGFSLVSKQRYSEALETLQQCLVLQDDDAVKVYAGIVELKIAEEKELIERASIVREEADSLFKEKKFAEAFALFHDSLRIWRDEELVTWLTNEETIYNEAQAAQLRRDAEQLIKKNRREDALRTYRRSLEFAYNKAADDFVKEADAEAVRKRVAELVGEAEALLKQNKPEEALDRYKTALTKVPNDQKIIDEIKKLELVLMKAVSEPNDATLSVDTQPEYTISIDDNEQLLSADKIFREANALYSEKKYNEALEKYKESYELSNNAKLKEFIDRLENAIVDVEKANVLVRQANELYRQGKFSEALQYYEESLKVYKNPKVEEFIKKVKTLIN